MTLWYLARATGLVALVAFTVATALGAATSRRPAATTSAGLDRRFLVQAAHRSAAVVGLLLLAAHAALIAVDAYVDVSVTSLVVPFTAGYRPVALAAGTVALYAFVVASVSGALRGRLAVSPAAARRWRPVHLAAYGGWALSMGHGLFAGTDTGAAWTTALYVSCGLAVAAGLAVRLAPTRRSPAAHLPSRPALVRSSS